MTLLDADKVCVMRGTKHVVHNVSISLNPGEIVTIVGPNGSGKTSLLRALIGSLPASHGKITRAKDLRIGYVPQKLHLDPSLPLTVARFLTLTKGAKKAAVFDLLSRVGATGLEKRQLSDLSGGQFQRVLLARALQNDPQLLMLDEATQGLDQAGSSSFYSLIAELKDDLNCAILMVSHELHVVMAASDRVICLNGHICCEGAPAQVAAAKEYRALFGTGTQGTLALYQHDHDHDHDHEVDHVH